MSGTAKPKREMPKGGRKGGSIFPREPLADVVKYAQKLVVKTHSSPQPTDVIYSGVVNAKSGLGNIKISALKQFGFLSGNAKGYGASELAKKLVAAPPGEEVAFLRQAALRPSIFQKLFTTFHSDTVTVAKLKQRAADLNVHPEETERCVEVYIASLELAKLITRNGDQITHVSESKVGEQSPAENDDAESDAESDGIPPQNEQSQQNGVDAQTASRIPAPVGDAIPPRAVIQVNVTLDSSLDTDKLEKQLQLLRRYGAI